MAKTKTKKAAKTATPRKSAPRAAKESKPVKQQSEQSAEDMYSMYVGARVNPDFPVSRKESNIHVDVIVDEETGETETHLLDLRQMPQDIVESLVQD